MTINQLIKKFGLRKDALLKFGLTYYIQKKYGDVEELPEKIQRKFDIAKGGYVK